MASTVSAEHTEECWNAMTDGKCTNFESEALVKLLAERGYDVTHEHVVVTAKAHDIQGDEEIERSAFLAMCEDLKATRPVRLAEASHGHQTGNIAAEGHAAEAVATAANREEALPIITASEVQDAVVCQYVFVPPFDIAAVPDESRQQVEADVAKMTSELEKEFNDRVSKDFDSFYVSLPADMVETPAARQK